MAERSEAKNAKFRVKDLQISVFLPTYLILTGKLKYVGVNNHSLNLTGRKIIYYFLRLF